MNSAQLKLLSVDDDASSAELIVRVAERCGIEAFATSESRGVMNLVTTLKPDVVVVDISMPHLDALELFKLLAAARYTGAILIVSGQDDQVLQVTAHAATALGLSTPSVHRKPIKIQAFRESLLQVKPLNAA
jgi:PleD family two-component response regulator